MTNNNGYTNDQRLGLIIGLAVSDGCFSIYWERDSGNQVGWQVKLSLQISQISDPLVLAHLKPLLKGSSIPLDNKPGNLKVTGISRMAKLLKEMVPYKELFASYKRQDFLLIAEASQMFVRKEHLTHEGRKKLLDMREKLHVDSAPKRMTREQYEKEFQIAPGSSVGCAKDLLKKIEAECKAHESKVVAAMVSNTYEVNPYYCTGVFCGDGSFYISCGLHQIMPVITLISASASKITHQIAMYGMTGGLAGSKKLFGKSWKC
jgi:hypothetical protein